MSEFGLYHVCGKRDYRGHKPGETFEARLDRLAAHRAVTRGDIELLAIVTPDLQPGSFTFPEGWLAQPHTSSQKEPREGLF